MKDLYKPESAGVYTIPLSIKHLAALFGVHENTMSRWLRDGQIDARKVGGRWRVHVTELPAMPDDDYKQFIAKSN